MTLANILKDRVQIQVKTTVQTSTGQTEVWSPVQIRNARVIPLDAKARAVYQQLQSQVSHKVIFRGNVSLSLGKNRLLWNDKILEPVDPIQYTEDSAIVVVREV